MTLLIVCIASSCTLYARKERRNILVINSYEPEYAGYKSLEEKIDKEFKHSGVNAETKYFYLDCDSYQEAAELQRMYHLFDSLQDWKPEIILVYDDQATYSLVACKHPIINQLPIVFAGVNYPNWDLLKKYPNITGFWDKSEFLKTADISEQLFGPMRINFWLDETFLGRKSTYNLLKELQSIGITHLGNSEFTLSDNETFHMEKDTLIYKNPIPKKPEKTIYATLNSRSSTSNEFLWNLSGLAQYSTFIQSKRDFTTKRIGLFAGNPTLTVINEGFGFNEGLLGGYITSQETEIKLSVETVAKILKGANINTIPIVATPKEYMLDWTEIKRWGIPLSTVPHNYKIVNMPFAERYKVHLIVAGTFLGIALILFICYLIHLYLGENNKRKQAQEKLEASERFLSLSLAGGKVFAFQLKNEVFHFDPDFYIAVGIEELPIPLKKFRSTIYPKDRIQFYRDVSDANNGNRQENISRIRCKFNGTAYQWWEFRYAYNKEDETFSGLCLNIQKAKEEEQELINARKKAEESDKMKSAFLANMSHEIRTPLNAIVGFSNIIGTEEIELSIDEKKEFLKLINTNCELLLKLINDILDLSRIESGRMEFSFGECNLTELLNEVYHTHQLLMPENVTLKIEQPEKPTFIWTDRHRLTQVITNFINNAGKFTKSGYIKIGYHPDESSGTINLFVEDTGIGIAKDKLKSVFERFNKLNEFAQGTGLGLAICKVIVQRFGGSIVLTSEEGKGSCFTIKLPINEPVG